MTLGLYIPRPSIIHALPAYLKLLGLMLAGLGVFSINNGGVLAIGLAIVISLIFLAKLPVLAIWQQFRPLLLLLLLILLLHGLWGDWYTGWIAVLRFTILVSLATIVSLTTRVSEMMEAIEQALHPLSRVGIHPGKVSLTLALALRLIPVLLDQMQQIREAQQARGLDRHILALLVPFLIKTLRMADELSDALDARSYDPEL